MPSTQAGTEPRTLCYNSSSQMDAEECSAESSEARNVCRRHNTLCPFTLSNISGAKALLAGHLLIKRGRLDGIVRVSHQGTAVARATTVLCASVMLGTLQHDHPASASQHPYGSVPLSSSAVGVAKAQLHEVTVRGTR